MNNDPFRLKDVDDIACNMRSVVMSANYSTKTRIKIKKKHIYFVYFNWLCKKTWYATRDKPYVSPTKVSQLVPFFRFFLIFAEWVNVPVINHFPWQMHVYEMNSRYRIYIALNESSSRAFYRRRGNKCTNTNEESSENKWINSFNWMKSFFLLSFAIEDLFFENFLLLLFSYCSTKERTLTRMPHHWNTKNINKYNLITQIDQNYNQQKRNKSNWKKETQFFYVHIDWRINIKQPKKDKKSSLFLTEFFLVWFKLPP